MRPSLLSYCFLGSFLTTLFLLQWWQRADYPMILWIVLALTGIALIVVGVHRGHPCPRYLLSIVLGTSLALFLVAHATHVPSPVTIDFHAAGQKVILHGTIADYPDDRTTKIVYEVEASGLQFSQTGETLKVSGIVLVTDRSMWPRPEYGDKVTVRGVLEKPMSTDDFAYDRYLQGKNIYAVITASSWTDIQPAREFLFLKPLFASKTAIEATINRLLPQPESALLIGLLTGSRGSMSPEVLLAFKRTGLTHIIAISGFNITIIMTVIAGCLFFLPYRWRFVPTIIAITLFTIFTGASASVVRAAIMGILGLMAMQAGRLKDMRLIILWAAFVMLIWNPSTLWYDAGFQLSFLCVLGVSECTELLGKYLEKLPAFFGIREGLTMTLSSQVTAVPWIAYAFGNFSLIAPISNILVGPLVPFAMLTGFFATVFGFIFTPLASVFALITWLILHIIILIASLLAAIPFAAFELPSFSVAVIVVYYLLLVTWLIRAHQEKS